VTATDYDDFDGAYSAESNLFNAHYERPEMLRLAAEISCLDAGCGSGPLTAALRAKGAAV
jgi:2-polyprenyl-3-methyl-5-hydroxy-6-metoxy-1,4-benzoquinol methylase